MKAWPLDPSINLFFHIFCAELRPIDISVGTFSPMVIGSSVQLPFLTSKRAESVNCVLINVNTKERNTKHNCKYIVLYPYMINSCKPRKSFLIYVTNLKMKFFRVQNTAYRCGIYSYNIHDTSQHSLAVIITGLSCMHAGRQETAIDCMGV